MFSICTTDVNIKLAPDTPCAQSAADLQAYASAADLSSLGDWSHNIQDDARRGLVEYGDVGWSP